MNILLVSAIYPEPEYLNVPKDTNAVHYFARNWAAKGHKVVALHPHINPISRIFHHLKSKYRNKIIQSDIENVQVLFGQGQLLKPHTSVLPRGRQRRLAKRFKAYLNRDGMELEFDLITVHFPVALLHFAELFAEHDQSVCILHGSDISMLSSMSVAKRASAIEKLNRTYRMICFRSEVLKRQGMALGLGKADSPVLYSGIDDSLIAEPQAIENKVNAGFGQQIKILYAGKLVRQKCIDQILKALALVKDTVSFEFTLLGEGTERKELEELVRELGLEAQVKFLGSVPRTEVLQHMQEADVFTMVSANETFGLVYIEAMAQGCITIGTKNEGIDGIIKDGENGFLIEAYDYKALAQRIVEIYSMSQEHRAQMIRQGYDTVKDMTDSNMAALYLEKVTDRLA